MLLLLAGKRIQLPFCPGSMVQKKPRWPPSFLTSVAMLPRLPQRDGVNLMTARIVKEAARRVKRRGATPPSRLPNTDGQPQGIGGLGERVFI